MCVEIVLMAVDWNTLASVLSQDSGGLTISGGKVLCFSLPACILCFGDSQHDMIHPPA